MRVSPLRVYTNTWPFELVAMPMPSPKYRSGGSLKKSGTEVKGISGTFSALALDCAVTVAGATGMPPPRKTEATTAAKKGTDSRPFIEPPPAGQSTRPGQCFQPETAVESGCQP